MLNANTSIKNRHRKHIKLKERLNQQSDFGTPPVSPRQQEPQLKHELLSDCSDAS